MPCAGATRYTVPTGVEEELWRGRRGGVGVEGLKGVVQSACCTFSIIGLVLSPGGDSKRLPAAEPVMMRMLPRLA